MIRVREQDAPGSPAPLALPGICARFPARPVTSGWPATMANREETLRRLTSAPFASDSAGTQKERVLGLASVLGWLEDPAGRQLAGPVAGQRSRQRRPGLAGCLCGLARQPPPVL